MIEGKTIAVWFSCGAASAVAAKKTIEIYGEKNTVLVINNPVDEEHPDNKRFLKDVEKWLGQPIIIATNSKLGHTSAFKIWEKRKYMAGREGAPCTMLLKKEARYEFEQNNHIDYHVLGFTCEEWARALRFKLGERANFLYVLGAELITKTECFKIVVRAGLKLPAIYGMNFPNANCIGCVKSSSATYWNLVREVFPDVFEKMALKSREIGCRLVYWKKKRWFLDELPADAKGGKLKSIECGIFCDT